MWVSVVELVNNTQLVSADDAPSARFARYVRKSCILKCCQFKGLKTALMGNRSISDFSPISKICVSTAFKNHSFLGRMVRGNISNSRVFKG